MDELLDDRRFFEPSRAHLDPVLGRPSVPIETRTTAGDHVTEARKGAHSIRVWLRRRSGCWTRPTSASSATFSRARLRLVSLRDPDARPIRKGRPGTPVELGYNARVVDNDDGIVLDHSVEVGNPPDAPMLVPAIERVAPRCGRPPDEVTADRGHGQARIDRELIEIVGVGYVAIPRPGKSTQERRTETDTDQFRELVRWRTGAAGRIFALNANTAGPAAASPASTEPETRSRAGCSARRSALPRGRCGTSRSWRRCPGSRRGRPGRAAR